MARFLTTLNSWREFVKAYWIFNGPRVNRRTYSHAPIPIQFVADGKPAICHKRWRRRAQQRYPFASPRLIFESCIINFCRSTSSQNTFNLVSLVTSAQLERDGIHSAGFCISNPSPQVAIMMSSARHDHELSNWQLA